MENLVIVTHKLTRKQIVTFKKCNFNYWFWLVIVCQFLSYEEIEMIYRQDDFIELDYLNSTPTRVFYLRIGGVIQSEMMVHLFKNFFKFCSKTTNRNLLLYTKTEILGILTALIIALTHSKMCL